MAGVLLLEIALFSWSFGQFFCGDSLFYLWYRIESPAQALRYLTQPDHLNSYRPLNYIVFSQLFFPLFKLNPLGYHVVSLAAHLLISLLVFRLLRELVSQSAAALAGLVFFGLHATNFYITYDASFLPDYGSGFFYVSSLLCYALYLRRGGGGWLSASLASFAIALLFKESAITLVAGIAVVDLLIRPVPRSAFRVPRWSIALYAGIAIGYLAWSFYIKAGRLYPTGPNQPYALTLDPAVLKLKLRYLAWLANLPAQISRRGWTSHPAIIAMLPALAWIVWQAVRGSRQLWREMIMCAAWAVLTLAPVLLIKQQPMKHNLYMPLVACAVALGLLLQSAEADHERLLPRWWFLLLGGMVIGTAFQVPGDLRFSWVGEGSRIAEKSLQTMKRERPTLPRGAILYVLPTSVEGQAAWYFQGGALFKLFYRDASIQMRFADLEHTLPKDFASRPDVLLFRFYEERLWDVTRRPLARGKESRLALIAVPGLPTQFASPAVAAGSALQVGLTVSGPMQSGARGRILFEDGHTREQHVLLTATLDAVPDGDRWWDAEVDLAPIAGRSGTILLETQSFPNTDWLAWSQPRIVQRDSSHPEAASDGDSALPPVEYRLLDRFEQAEIGFDRSNQYPNYSKFGTPDGKPVFLYAARQPAPGRFTMVTIAGASVKYQFQALPAAAILEITAINLGQIGDGVRGRVFIEDSAGRENAKTLELVELADPVDVHSGSREEIYDELLPPRGQHWVPRTIPLSKWAGRPVALIFEASPGPRGQTVADWCAWGRLRIVTGAASRQ